MPFGSADGLARTLRTLSAGTSSQQCFHHFQVSIPTCDVQWCGAISGGGLEAGGSSSKQALHNISMSVLTRDKEGCHIHAGRNIGCNPSCQQDLHHFEVTILSCNNHWCRTVSIGDIKIGSGGHQHLYHSWLPHFAGHKQLCGSRIRCCLNASASSQQLCHHLNVATLRSNDQRCRPGPEGNLDVGSCCKKPLHDREMSCQTCGIQWSRLSLLRCVDHNCETVFIKTKRNESGIGLQSLYSPDYIFCPQFAKGKFQFC